MVTKAKRLPRGWNLDKGEGVYWLSARLDLPNGPSVLAEAWDDGAWRVSCGWRFRPKRGKSPTLVEALFDAEQSVAAVVLKRNHCRGIGASPRMS